MEIKFKKDLTNFDYLVMFDLASKITGVCLWDIKCHRPVDTQVIKVKGDLELPVAELEQKIDQYFTSLNKKGILLDRILVSFEAAPSQIRSGAASTIQTFISLAQAHAILNLYIYKNGIPTYDYVGVYPISTHAYLKKINGWEKDHPVEKADIKNYVCETYGIGDITLDESDSVFLAQTLLDSKWNNDLDERVREIKRHRKTLKAEHAIIKCDEEIERLKCLKNGGIKL